MIARTRTQAGSEKPSLFCFCALGYNDDAESFVVRDYTLPSVHPRGGPGASVRARGEYTLPVVMTSGASRFLGREAFHVRLLSFLPIQVLGFKIVPHRVLLRETGSAVIF